MIAKILDGKDIAAKVRKEVSDAVLELKKNNANPGLATVIVGEDPASKVYIRNKNKSANELGIESFQYNLKDNIPEEELLNLISKLNNNLEVDGILVQLPLPKHINTESVIDAIRPDKDVDGFNVLNAGNLYLNKNSVIPCTPLGCIIMLHTLNISLKGLHAVIIGRSTIVGKPLSQLLLKENCTVTVVHSHTKDVKNFVKEADIVIAAVGIANYVQGDWIKKGSIIIDVGINRITKDGKTILVGDVDFEEAAKKASVISPVPGGVGPMTIACLLMNTVIQCAKHNNINLNNYFNF